MLSSQTDIFAPGTRILEVAPTRGLEALLRANHDVEYTSFDLSRSAMEKGDLTSMGYADESAGYFVCFHVLEHVADEEGALREIHRVLRPGGYAALQVPMDWQLDQTIEYGAPDPREVGHVRRYGRDFPERVSRRGFEVEAWRAADFLRNEEIRRFGLSNEPIFLARKLSR
jgi:predicted SAM-dependent methyltransferase